MKCYICETELIWGGDHDGEDLGIEEADTIVTNLSCPHCDAFHEVTWNKGDKNDTV